MKSPAGTSVWRAAACLLALTPWVTAFLDAAVAAAADEQRRLVRFAISPGGARLVLDGNRTRWFGQTIPLATGVHRVAVDVPDSRCCEPIDRALRVEPAKKRGAEKVQVVVIQLKVRPARVTLVGAPPKGTMSCPELGLVVAAARVATVAMTSVSWDGTCRLTSGTGATPTTRRVRLHAGELVAVRWHHP